jgi:hypothetical protein
MVGEHHELAMRDVDDAHDAEGQRQAETEEAIEAAHHQAIEDRFDVAHWRRPPK